MKRKTISIYLILWYLATLTIFDGNPILHFQDFLSVTWAWLSPFYENCMGLEKFCAIAYRLLISSDSSNNLSSRNWRCKRICKNWRKMKQIETLKRRGRIKSLLFFLFHVLLVLTFLLLLAVLQSYVRLVASVYEVYAQVQLSEILAVHLDTKNLWFQHLLKIFPILSSDL